jgi:phosphoribosylamine--glycine ligase
VHVLIVGSGGREHALAWKISQSPLVKRLTCAPGNAGTAEIGENVGIGGEDLDALVAFAKKESVDLAVVGPEAPLVLGLVDRLDAAGIRAFGPSAKGAQLEGSKAFCKDLLRRNNVPTAIYEVFDDAETALGALETWETYPLVVKADGLAAGKGVIICADRKEAEEAVAAVMKEKQFGSAGDRLVLEDFLEGEEASILALTDGSTLVALPTSQDHKQVLDGDRGLNTGGMGAYSPAPVITSALQQRIEKDILIPTVHGLKREGIRYKGVLYAGLMITKSGPKVLEYNVRFGDPETQPVLMNIESDIVPLLIASAEGGLDKEEIRTRSGFSVCVVMASGGYPQSYEKGFEIRGLEDAGSLEGVVVFHAGTKEEGGAVLTAGGRVLGVTAACGTLSETKERAYQAVEKISFQDSYYRKDISDKGLRHL